jgi:hypothetical protein
LTEAEYIAKLEQENARLKILEEIIKHGGRYVLNNCVENGKTILDFMNCWLDQARKRAETAEHKLTILCTLRPREEYRKDYGPVLWWFNGSVIAVTDQISGDSAYLLHWTPLPEVHP